METSCNESRFANWKHRFLQILQQSCNTSRFVRWGDCTNGLQNLIIFNWSFTPVLTSQRTTFVKRKKMERGRQDDGRCSRIRGYIKSRGISNPLLEDRGWPTILWVLQWKCSLNRQEPVQTQFTTQVHTTKIRERHVDSLTGVKFGTLVECLEKRGKGRNGWGSLVDC
jgi:hypothetical protein